MRRGSPWNRIAGIFGREDRIMSRWRAVAVSVLAMSGMVVAGPDTAAEAEAAGPLVAVAPLVDVALSGLAWADSALAGHGPGLAVDGDGATSWCPAGEQGSMLLDLGRYQGVEGFGVTLMGGVAQGGVRIDTGAGPGRLRPVASAAALATGTPTWFTGARGSARYVRVEVTGGSCVGELRVLGHGRGMVVGDDLSFAVQEAAIGNVYRDRGAQALPERILAAHGANFVRLRLWNDPPGGYSDLDSVLTMARRGPAARMQVLLRFHHFDF